jgi:hypothetical protein
MSSLAMKVVGSQRFIPALASSMAVAEPATRAPTMITSYRSCA